MWVAEDYRRKKIASRLVDAMKINFLFGTILEKGQYAFSHTTPDGSRFASKYVGLLNGGFLTYKHCNQSNFLYDIRTPHNCKSDYFHFCNYVLFKTSI